MSCDTAELLLAAAAVGSLDSDEDAQALRGHLRGCAHCRAEAAAYARATEMLALAVEPMAPPPGLRSRLMSQVHGAVAASSAGRVDAAPPPGLLRRLWDRIPTGRGLTVAGGLAMAAAVVLGVWGLGNRHTQPAPVVATIPDCAPASGPPASCTLDYNPVTHDAVLGVRGLVPPASTDGRSAGTFEVWLMPRTGAPQPITFLTRSPGGDQWTAAMSGDMSQYTAVVATYEPPGGSVRPTGPEVVRVNLPSAS